MKINYFLILLFSALAVCAVSCGGGDDDDPEPAKSNACDILSFKVGSDSWNIDGTSISFIYPKGTAQGNLTPDIIVSDLAKINPASGVMQNFFTGNGVTYTVTAEDGSTKSYIAKATVAAN